MDCRLQKEELEFWEGQKRCGDEMDLKLARDLPDDTPDFILKMMVDFENEAARFCFSGAEGRVLDAGCGNGNLLLRALKNENVEEGKQAKGRPAVHRHGFFQQHAGPGGFSGWRTTTGPLFAGHCNQPSLPGPVLRPGGKQRRFDLPCPTPRRQQKPCRNFIAF